MLHLLKFEKDWLNPSIKYAKMFFKENHPHHASEIYQKYDMFETTTGRHCVMDGCGSQLDLWDEGQVSEFAQFGAGVTNYFKFLKWCCWIFFCLSVMYIPAMILNSLGAQAQYEGMSLAQTTMGNLGDSVNVTFVKIREGLVES